jgi:transcriptional regulator with XRE-family HTH domain
VARHRSANQIVAHNLKRARLERGWSLEETADMLEPFVGQRWTRQNLSALENSAVSGKRREFDADLLVALAQAFELPLLWFFIPPENTEAVDTKAKSPIRAADLLDLLFMRGWEKIRARLRELPDDQRYGFKMADAAETIDLYITHALSEIPDLIEQLHNLAWNLGYALDVAAMEERKGRRGGEYDVFQDESHSHRAVKLPTKKTLPGARPLSLEERTIPSVHGPEGKRPEAGPDT